MLNCCRLPSHAGTDVWQHVLPWVGPGHYLQVAPVSKAIQEAHASAAAHWQSGAEGGRLPEELARCTALRNVVRHSCPEAETLLLQWAFDNGCPTDHLPMAAAAELGSIDLARCSRTNGCSWIVSEEGADPEWNVADMAALHGHQDLLEWALAQGCPYGNRLMAVAAENNRLDMLQWLHARGCPVDEGIAYEACLGGHVQILEWALAHGFPIDSRMCSMSAAQCAHQPVLQMLHDAGQLDDAAGFAAVYFNQVPALAHLRSLGWGWERFGVPLACNMGHLQLLQWARTQGEAWETTLRQGSHANGLH